MNPVNRVTPYFLILKMLYYLFLDLGSGLFTCVFGLSVCVYILFPPAQAKCRPHPLAARMAAESQTCVVKSKVTKFKTDRTTEDRSERLYEIDGHLAHIECRTREENFVVCIVILILFGVVELWHLDQTIQFKCENKKFVEDFATKPLSKAVGKRTIFFILGWGETESTWYFGRCLAYCTSPA
jgi:hypothetical protein